MLTGLSVTYILLAPLTGHGLTSVNCMDIMMLLFSF